MIDKVNKDIISFLMKSNLPSRDPSQVQQDKHKRENLQASRPGIVSAPQNPQRERPKKVEPVRVEQKVGRNETVIITNGKERKKMKWKKAKPLIESGKWAVSQ